LISSPKHPLCRLCLCATTVSCTSIKINCRSEGDRDAVGHPAVSARYRRNRTLVANSDAMGGARKKKKELNAGSESRVLFVMSNGRVAGSQGVGEVGGKWELEGAHTRVTRCRKRFGYDASRQLGAKGIIASSSSAHTPSSIYFAKKISFEFTTFSTCLLFLIYYRHTMLYFCRKWVRRGSHHAHIPS
jgi:hypothetical protein